MNYDHDCPFEAYITNLGKYNEGALVGEWVKFPTTYDEIQKVFERIGIGKEYEEWFITDYDCYVDGLHDILGEYESLDELNYLANKIEDMDSHDLMRFEAVIPVSDYSRSVKDLINLADNLDKYEVYSDVHDHDDLGRMYIEEYGAMEVPDHLKNYIDYEAYGRDIALDEGGSFTNHGYIRETGDEFTEYYDGSRDDIPIEYRVMTNPEAVELSEDEKLDMAQDLAFDLDEFFRQKDPQYAAAHADAHASKELIADLLLEGKTAAIKDRLAEMAQLPDDELPSRIGEYEQVTGYEAYLDTDVLAIRAKLEQAQEVKPLEPDDFIKSGERIETPRGSFSLTDMTREQMEAAGYGYHHSSDDGRHHIMGNGTRAFAIVNEQARTYEIYQLKDSPDRRDYAFEPLDRLHEQGRTVDMQNYDKVYSGALRPGENPESIYTRFNIDHPRDFTGHSLSVSDVVVLHQNGQDTAHYCDSLGFTEVPEFLQPDNYLKNAEMAMEDDYGMIDGIINNGEKEIVPPGADEKPSLRERLAEAKRECAERKPPDKKPERGGPEHNL
ncbi:antirestriction protein ArdA [Oscillospiraceae bacterium OttesenSCG-928-G22]|nr:antirestriction protein ArdA [Eubacteriales bacterium OttesenSCG-928-K08]MDL2273696.1 antirestriction protein ArdA [Oscillospiraceae bacterium OttesenSCG-928-G22]MDL2288599.1 antirestriction protein ArdA [Oscillospiraceae bacterium OttesenSCG-928-F05]MDL2300074.1 antirestriction protein ArdA [Clostridiaceae bacterium OttesenSCG-928-D20]